MSPLQKRVLEVLGEGRDEQQLQELRNAVEVVGDGELEALIVEDLVRRDLQDLPIFRRILWVFAANVAASAVAFAEWSTHARRRRVRGVPGQVLRTVADFVYSSKTVERVFETTLADLQTEYCKALAEGRGWKARWVRLRGYGSFWNAVANHGLISFLDSFLRIWKLIG